MPKTSRAANTFSKRTLPSPFSMLRSVVRVIPARRRSYIRSSWLSQRRCSRWRAIGPLALVRPSVTNRYGSARIAPLPNVARLRILQRRGAALRISHTVTSPIATTVAPQSQTFASSPSSVRGGYCRHESWPAEPGQPSTKISGASNNDEIRAARNAPIRIAAVRSALRSGRTT
jgi:hypothetical protein